MSLAAAPAPAASAGTGIHAAAALSNKVWPLLVLTGVLGSGVAFTIQILAQREISATRAVFLLAGESIFSAFFAAIWLGERLLPHQWIGATLVLVAMAFSELAARRPGQARVDPAVP